ncbi:hypothetical protein RHSIM_Rhsim05G0040600 [Rhododendron simsii]|uniref:Uncharacterized protein n=1 Tax=Rhododendron simsii TaxID=118357 RepID=A0A834LMU3_RHOSS|nr:hypothetical protein RHSIM_Rhsim05G0040600 [Rhododendron simsii]
MMATYPDQKSGCGRETEPNRVMTKKKEKSPIRTWTRSVVTERGSLTEVMRKSVNVTTEKTQSLQFVFKFGREGSQGFGCLGTGGVKGALPALGADQFDQKVPKEAKALANYFNFLLFSTSMAPPWGSPLLSGLAPTKGGGGGFSFALLLLVLGMLCLLLEGLSIGSAPESHRMNLPESLNELYEIKEKESISQEHKLSHSKQFRLDSAWDFRVHKFNLD